MGSHRDNPPGIRSGLGTVIGESMVIADARADTGLGQLYIGVPHQPFVVGLGYWIVPDARAPSPALSRRPETWTTLTRRASRASGMPESLQ